MSVRNLYTCELDMDGKLLMYDIQSGRGADALLSPLCGLPRRSGVTYGGGLLALDGASPCPLDGDDLSCPPLV